jgi:prophage antirepressor-like protein
MARKTGTPVEKIKDFTSLADHDASTLKEGHVTLLKFDSHTIRRIIHNGEPFYSVVDAVGALVETQAKDAGAYWRKLKQRLLEEARTRS